MQYPNTIIVLYPKISPNLPEMIMKLPTVREYPGNKPAQNSRIVDLELTADNVQNGERAPQTHLRGELRGA